MGGTNSLVFDRIVMEMQFSDISSSQPLLVAWIQQLAIEVWPAAYVISKVTS